MNKEFGNEIGIRIRSRRKELNLTQTQIKTSTGISSGNLSEIENGNKLPSTPALISLSSILNCSIDWILTGTSSNREILNEYENILLDKFNQLSPDGKAEIMEIIEMKLRRQFEKEQGKSYPSTTEKLT